MQASPVSGASVSKLGRALVLLGIANFTTFWFATMAMGGSALNGKVEDGHYFLGEHGKYTEVTSRQFQFSAWHTRSIFLTHGLGALGALLLYSIDDPFVTRRNRRRDAWLLGTMAVSMALGVLGGQAAAWVPFMVFPLAILAGILLDLRDADRPHAAHDDQSGTP
jgi:hypothetical protein